jgi:hypothetical protein
MKHADYHALLSDPTFPELARHFRAYAFLVAADAQQAGQAYINAAWVCDDAEQTTEAQECRRRAADCLMQSKPIDNSEGGITSGAILVDVLRRSGQFVPALAIVQELLSLSACRDILRQVVLFQQRLLDAQDTNGYTVDQALQTST